jgi:SAM-dependent methyltransferase
VSFDWLDVPSSTPQKGLRNAFALVRHFERKNAGEQITGRISNHLLAILHKNLDGSNTVLAPSSAEILRQGMEGVIMQSLASWYLSLAPSHPPSHLLVSKPLQRARMEYEDEVAGGFLKWFPSLSLAGKDVLDLGCGYGGRSVRYAELGARSITGIEPVERHCSEAREFALSHNVAATFVFGFGESLPLPNDSFDCVLSYDVFEHVCDVRETLKECLRVLRSGGSLYAVFPPFHHPTGSHFDDWLSKMPWPNVLFPCHVLVKAGTNIISRRAGDYRPNPLRSTDKLWGLNGITIGKLRQIVNGLDADFSISLAPLFSPLNGKWESWRMKYYAPIFAPLRHVPILQECFTHRIVLTMTKPN